ncbi:LexA family protein [Flavobacterium phycosphaerae]|uniref:LexA family protein n=1 Tax=Flavobacterium phycosphaerae TaxID=2697515 RepID=UPI00374248E4
MFGGGIKAGFPSPAADFDETRISLDNVLVKNHEATFYAKASGTSMTGAGIDDGDIMVIDRSLEPTDGKIAVCCIDGEFTVKRIQIQKDGLFLLPENKDFQPIKVTQDNQLLIWGIVTYVIKRV